MTLRDTLTTQYPAHQLDESGIFRHLGKLESELKAAATATIVAPLGQYGLLSIEGEEAADFLHKQLTNDVLKLPETGARHAAWCTAKGRMLASLLVYRQGQSCFALIARELAENTRKRMQMFILRAKAKATDISNSMVVLGIAGPDAAKRLQEAGLPVPEAISQMDLLPCASANAIRLIRLDAQRCLIVAPAEQAEALWQQLSAKATPVGVTAWQWLDVQAGLPVVTGPTVEEFVPQMVDFDQIGGVSFKKGCYPGQEVVARTHYLGKVKRHLYRVLSPAPLAAGNPLFSGENTVGMVVSGAPSPQGGYAGLAVMHESAEAGVSLGVKDGPVLTVSPVHPAAEAV